MDKMIVAKELVKIAKGLVSKTYPVLLDDPVKNRQIWRDIEDVAEDVSEELTEEGVMSNSVFAEKAKQLAKKYGKGQDLDFVFMVKDFLAEEVSSFE